MTVRVLWNLGGGTELPLRHPYFRISILRGLCLLSILLAYTSMREDFFWCAGFIFHFIFLSAMGMGKGTG